jgi:hypothetical protein
MKRLFLVLIVISMLQKAQAQKVDDLFKHSDVSISWLGLDFSHAKMIGDFSQFKEAGGQSAGDIKNRFYPAWNKLFVNEQKKYDVNEMLHKEDIVYEIDMILGLNAKIPVEDIEATNTPNYKSEDIAGFVKAYNTNGKNGIGVVFVVESFNKGAEQSIIHFVAMNMATKEILLQERLVGKPRGFGLRNYWAGSIYGIMNDIRDTQYKAWKRKYVK